jgi:hypothetical protein
MPRKKGRGRVVGSAAELARKASARQRRLYGLNGARVPEHEQWRLELDEKYLADLAKDPEAAQFLSVFNEEVSRGVYQRDEPHLHEREAFLASERERDGRRRNKDVMSFGAYRGPSLNDEDTVGHDPDSWLADQTNARPTDTEDALIEKIDRQRAVALRVRPNDDDVG